MTATWTRIREVLVAAGRLHPQGHTRRAQPRLCRRCDARVLIGLDADVAALPVTVDPTPLTPLGEALAQLEGRYTVELFPDARGHVMDTRTDTRILHRPADVAQVLPEHRCGTPLPPALTRPPDPDIRHTPLPPSGAPAPF